MDNPSKVERIQNPSVADVVQGMIRFAMDDSTSDTVLALRNLICNGLTSGDYASEALACNYWVHQNIRYIKDPILAEYVRDSKRLLESRSGDCDDMAVLLAALLMACGNRCSFVLASFNGAPHPSHVFVCLHTPRGDVMMDPVANTMTGRMLASASKLKLVPITGGASAGGAW